MSARAAELASGDGAAVQVRSGESADVAVHLTGGTVLLVQVTDKMGDEVRARISVRDDAGREVNGMIAYREIIQLSGGISFAHQRVGPLPPGRYVVTAVAEDGRQTTKPVQLSGQPERKLRVRLR